MNLYRTHYQYRFCSSLTWKEWLGVQHIALNKVNIFSSDKGQKNHITSRPTRHLPLSSLQGRTAPPLGRSPAAPLCPPPALRVQPPSVPLTPAPVLKTSRAPQNCRRGRRCHFPRSRIRRPRAVRSPRPRCPSVRVQRSPTTALSSSRTRPLPRPRHWWRPRQARRRRPTPACGGTR